MKTIEREIVVIGAGPAGLCAAIEAARAGAQVMLVDENSRPGGQLFKQIHKFFGSAEHMAGTRGYEIAGSLARQAADAGVEFWPDTVAYGIFKEGVGLVRGEQGYIVKAGKTIVAAGGSEDPVAFPGSTLPGVMTAGAAQTLVNVHRVLPGRRIVILGSGNVGLILAYQLLQAGAAVIERAERIGGYGVHAAKIRRAGVPILTGSTVVAAEGTESLERLHVAAVAADGSVVPGSEQTIEADTLCLAVGMSPLTELLWQAGADFDYIAELGGFVPLHDSRMESTVPGLYVAGDVTGVEEAPIAMEEGRLAGIYAAEACGRLESAAAENLRAHAIERISQLESGTGESRKRARHKQLNDMQRSCCGKEC
mgnify:FL=1